MSCDLNNNLTILLTHRFRFVTQLSQTLNQDIKVISLVCFPHMMSHAYWLVIPPMYAILIEAFGLTGPFAYTQVAFLTTVFATSTFVFQTPVGFIVDRIGARAVLIGGLSLEAVAIGLFSVATEYWHLLILASLAGMGHTVFHPADYAILSSRRERKAYWTSLLHPLSDRICRICPRSDFHDRCCGSLALARVFLPDRCDWLDGGSGPGPAGGCAS